MTCLTKTNSLTYSLSFSLLVDQKFSREFSAQCRTNYFSLPKQRKNSLENFYATIHAMQFYVVRMQFLCRTKSTKIPLCMRGLSDFMQLCRSIDKNKFANSSKRGQKYGARNSFTQTFTYDFWGCGDTMLAESAYLCIS